MVAHSLLDKDVAFLKAHDARDKSSTQSQRMEQPPVLESSAKSNE